MNTKKKSKYEVVIIQRRLCDYRVQLFESLRLNLAKHNVSLRLLYGSATAEEKQKNDGADIAWGEKLPTRYLLGGKICWQPFHSKVNDADLVIITQENKLVCNLWSLYCPRNYKLAFWGHGKNLQANQRSIIAWVKERFKISTTNRVDWWFAYTSLSFDLVRQLGFSAGKITNLQNAIESYDFSVLCNSITRDEIAQLKGALNLGNGPIAVYLGSLFKEKRIDFLLDAASQIVIQIPQFKLIVIGDGDEAEHVRQLAKNNDWLVYVGRKTGYEKALYLKSANVLLNPGMVGLGILDSFIAGVPLITTDCGIHSPEIAYLENGKNGIMTENNIEAYVAATVNLLSNAALSSDLRSGAHASSKIYTLEHMTDRFSSGILKALG